MEDLRELFQIMTRRFGLLNKNCCQIGGTDISLVQSHILYEILRKERPSMQQVADALRMDITTFSRQIQTLIKMELVKKSPLSDDRRVSVLSLTTQGNFIAASIDEQMNQYLNKVFSHMSDFEKDVVINSIKLLNEAMSKSSVCCIPLI
jgi:DNA-binding MarR family transcriptional regulator